MREARSIRTLIGDQMQGRALDQGFYAREDVFARFNDHAAPIPEGVAAFPVANENGR